MHALNPCGDDLCPPSRSEVCGEWIHTILLVLVLLAWEATVWSTAEQLFSLRSFVPFPPLCVRVFIPYECPPIPTRLVPIVQSLWA